MSFTYVCDECGFRTRQTRELDDHVCPEKEPEPWDGYENEDDVCSRCGAENWSDGIPNTYVTVFALKGEEGYFEVTQVLCNTHLIEVAVGLRQLGFITHNHHGTNILDIDRTCGGYGECPEEAPFGPELVRYKEPTV